MHTGCPKEEDWENPHSLPPLCHVLTHPFSTLQSRRSQAELVRLKRDPSAPVPPRQAFCVVLAPPSFDVHEVVVTLSPGGGPARASVASWERIDGASLDGQPLATPDDCLARHHVFLSTSQNLASRFCCYPANYAATLPRQAAARRTNTLVCGARHLPFVGFAPPSRRHATIPLPFSTSLPLLVPPSPQDAERIARADPKVLDLLAQRGIDVALVRDAPSSRCSSSCCCVWLCGGSICTVTPSAS